MRASAIRLNGNEDRVDVLERLGVVGLEHPALLADVILIEDSQTPRFLFVRSFAAPGLKCVRRWNTGLRIQVERIKDQTLAFGIEHPPIGFCRSFLGNVVDELIS